MESESEFASATERRAREVFDASVQGLDAHTRSRLNQARQAATAELKHARRSPWLAWAPAGALAGVALVSVMLWQGPGGGSGAPKGQPAVGGNAAEAVELLSAGEDLDLAKEDLAFYDWVEVEAGASHDHGIG